MMKQFVSYGHTKGIMLSLVVAVLMGALCTPVSAGDALLDMMPEKTLFCVRLNGLDQTFGKLDQFLMGLAPINLTMMGKMQLGGMLGNPQLTGLNATGPIALIALPGPGGMPVPSMGLLVPVNDYKQFTSSCQSMQAQADGMYSLSLGSKQFMVAEVASFALIAPQVDATQLQALKTRLTSGDKSLGSVLEASHAKQAAGQPLWLFVNTAVIAQTFGPMAQMMLSQAQAMMGPQGNAAATQEMSKHFMDVLAQQTRYATVSLNPSAEKLGIEAKLISVPKTELAQKLTRSGKPRDAAMAGFLQDGAVLNLTGQVISKFVSTKMQALSLSTQMKDSADAEKTDALMQDVVAQFKGSDALSIKLVPAAPFVTFQYVAQVKDGKALQPKVQELMGIVVKNMSDENISFESQPGVKTYQGVTIDGMKWSTSMSQSPIQGLEYRLACVDNYYVVTAGAGMDQAIESLIGKIKGGKTGTAPAEVTQAMQAQPQAKNADMVATLNLARIATQFPQGDASSAAPAMSVPTQSNMTALMSLDQGQAKLDIELPKTHLQELVQAIQMKMTQRMMQQQQQQP